MKAKPVVPREQAERDVEDALAHDTVEDAEAAALGFIEALGQAYARIGRHPATGSPRYAHELNLPGLRSWPLARSPYRVFYVERSDQTKGILPDKAALCRPLTGYYDAIVAQAAALMESLAINHPFVSGNKRIAFAGADVFLSINGWRSQRTPMQICAEMTQLFETDAFDIAHLDPRLRSFAIAAE